MEISLSKLPYNFFDDCANVKRYLSTGGDAVGSQKNTNYSGYIGFIRGTGILRNQNKPDIQEGWNQRRAVVPLFPHKGNSAGRTGKYRFGRHAYANAD